jgi:hypothetical protein
MPQTFNVHVPKSHRFPFGFIHEHYLPKGNGRSHHFPPPGKTVPTGTKKKTPHVKNGTGQPTQKHT